MKNNIRTRMPTMNDKIPPNHNKVIEKACYKHLERCNINFFGGAKKEHQRLLKTLYTMSKGIKKYVGDVEGTMYYGPKYFMFYIFSNN
jgi:hypothetical protein